MLSENDRRTLRELERRLAAEDAAFVERFAEPGPSRPNRTQPGLAQIVGGLTMGGLMLLAGSTAGAMAFGAAAVAVGVAWWLANDPSR